LVLAFWVGIEKNGGMRGTPERQLLMLLMLLMLSLSTEDLIPADHPFRRIRVVVDDMLFKWFLDLVIDERAFDATTFTKNRQRVLDHEIARVFCAAVVTQAKLRRYMSSEHFSVDGTLLQAWASNKSFTPNEPSDGDGNGLKGRNTEVGFKGQKRSNTTHTSTTDPEAMLFGKSNNAAAGKG
jgi:hypothetical protein